MTVREWLLEKQSRGVRDVRVTSVLKHIQEDSRRNGRSRRTPKRLDLVGTAEAAEMLGVERPRIGRWKKKGILPEPVAELAAGPVWFREQIEGVLEERERRRRTTSATTT